MDNRWVGFLAIVFFLILILLFIGAAIPEVAAEPGTALLAPSVVDNNTTVITTPLLLTSPTVVTSGQPIIMPTLQAGTATYIVQTGDWLNDIARRHNTTAAAILAVNPQLASPDVIYPGQVLVLP